MRMKYVIVLVFAGVLIAAVPGVDGYYYKNTYAKLLTAFGENAPVKIKIVNYRLGWLSSDAQLSVDFNPSNTKKPDPAYIVTVNQHITHGPFVQNPVNGGWVLAEAVLQSRVHLDKKTEVNLIGADSTAGIVQIDSVAKFNDHYQNQVKTSLFSVKISETGKLTWQGVTGDIGVNFVNNKLKYLKSDLSSGAFAIQDASGNLSIPAMKLQSERECQQTILCAGSSEFSVPGADGIINNTSMKLVGVNIKTAYGLNARNVYHVNTAFAMNKLTLPDYTVGPVSITFAMNDVNAESLSKLLEISRSAAVSSDEDVQSQRLVMLAEYNKEIPHLITASTVINQEIHVDTSYGNFVSIAKFYWPASTPLPTTSQDFARMNFKVDMHGNTKLVDQLVKVLDARQGYTDSDTVPAKTDVPVAAAVPAPLPVNYAKTLLDPYVTSHQVMPGVINELTDLQDKHLSPAIYNLSVDKIIFPQRLSRDVVKLIAQQLKDHYAANYKESDTDGDVAALPEKAAEANVSPAIKTPVASVPLSPEVSSSRVAPAENTNGRFKQQLDAMIRQGYITQELDDYAVSIIYENSTMKINGYVVLLPSSSSAPTAPAQ